MPRLGDLGIATRWFRYSKGGGPRDGQRFPIPFCVAFLTTTAISGRAALKWVLPILPPALSPMPVYHFCERAIAANGRAVVPVPGPMDPDPKGALFP